MEKGKRENECSRGREKGDRERGYRRKKVQEQGEGKRMENLRGQERG